MQANGGLMLLLAYLLRNDIRWREANIYLKLVVNYKTAVAPARDNLNQLLSELRMSATPQVILADGRSFERILQQTSRNADLIFLGMATPDENFVSYYEQLQAKVTGLPSTVFVLAAPNFSFSEVFNDSGTTLT